MPSPDEILETTESKGMARVAAVGCAMLVPVETWAGMGESCPPQKNVKYQALSHVHTHHSGLYQLPPHTLHWSLHLPLLLAPLDTSSPKVRCLAGRSYQGAGASAGLPPRPFLQESLSLPRCHRSLADGSQELSKEAPGPQSARNLLLLGRSWAGGEGAAVGWDGPGPSAPVLATGLSSPQGLLSCLDVQKDPGRKCRLRT